MTRDVILVDKRGNAVDTMEIFAAHTMPGYLHQAFSACVFRNSRKELLIQKRAETKPLFRHLWSNTCCSHPFPKEDVIQAGERRLQEELGFTCPLTKSDSFVYRAEDSISGLVEYERDTILIGDVTDITILPNPQEIEDWQWIAIDALLTDMKQNTQNYTPWFANVLKIALQYAHV